MLKRWILAAVVMIGWSMPVLGQALADRVPADAIVYIGWNGTDALAADYGQSTFKKLADQTQIWKNIAQFLPAIEKLAAQEPQAVAIIKSLEELFPILWRRPCAVYFGGASIVDGNPSAKFAIICDAGNNPAGMIQAIKNIAIQTGLPMTTNLYAGRYIAIGAVYPVPDAVEELLDNQAGDSLANLPAFKSAVGKTSAKAALTVFVDGANFIKMFDGLIMSAGSQRDKSEWARFKTALAVEEIQHMALSSGFSGADWSTRVFIESTNRRMTDTNKGTLRLPGVMKLVEASPISPDLMKLFPADSTMAIGVNANMDQLIKTVVEVLSAYEPRFLEDFNKAMTSVQNETGVNLQKDLLPALGSDWGVFLSPTLAGNLPTGIVLVNKLENPAKFMDAVNKLEKVANAALNQQLKRDKMTMSIRAVTVGKNELHYLTTPFASPAFAVRDGTLYLGLYAQPVIAAMDYAAEGGKSLAENPKFAALSKQIGGAKPTAFTFVDLPAVAKGGYGIAMVMDRIVAGFPDLAGIPMPEPMMPTLPQLMKNLTPMGTMAWQDDSGLYIRSSSPLPVIDLVPLGVNSITAGAVATGTAAIFPEFIRARERMDQMVCGANLRQIGTGLAMYANNHDGKLPTDLGVIATDMGFGPISPRVFVCPHSGKKIPEGLSPQDQAKWVIDNTDYVYLAAGLNPANVKNPNKTVLAYEKQNHEGFFNILFFDSHVETVDKARLDDFLAKTKENLAK